MLTDAAMIRAKAEFEFWWKTSEELKKTFKSLETTGYLRDKMVAWEAWKAAYEQGGVFASL